MIKASEIVNVIVDEANNQLDVNLYLEGHSWCAYERSAYHLASLKVPVVLKKEVVCDGYDVILLKALIDVNEMSFPLSPKTRLATVADDRLKFRMKMKIEGFLEWKSAQLTSMPSSKIGS